MQSNILVKSTSANSITTLHDYSDTTAITSFNDSLYTSAGVNHNAYTIYTDVASSTPGRTDHTHISLLSCNISLDDIGCTASPHCHVDIIDIIQLTVAFIGVICNVLAFITFVKNAKVFSKTVRILLGHQSLLDAVVCLVVTPVIGCKSLISDNVYLNTLMCYIWTSQFIYWSFLYLSVLNLLLIATERYLLICHPFIHQRYVGSYHKRALASCYVISLIINCPDFFMVSYKDKQCLHEPLFNTQQFSNFNSFYGFLCLCMFYIGPVICFIILYRNVLNVLSSRAHNIELGHTDRISRASKRFTKTVITVTVIFILSMGYDSIYYMLGQVGVVIYDNELLTTRIGFFLTIINSVSGPFVYLLFMPNFCLTFRNTFLCHKPKLVRKRSKEYEISKHDLK